MSKTPSNQDDETISSMCGFIKRFKRPRVLFQPSLGVLGFFFIGSCLICSFFFVDYNSLAKSYGLSGQTKKDDDDDLRKFDFLEEKGNGCDVFDGDWVWDETYPLYQSKDCRFMDQGFRCGENGRPDSLYTKWRWQPKACNLPRFDAKSMLEKLRNRRVVFVGDSIGRNQWESLLCLLSSAIQNKSSIYEVNGSPITKHTGSLVFKLDDYNCTVEYYRSAFLVLQTRPPPGSPQKVKTVLKLDSMDRTSIKWRDADVLVFNTGHWWNHEKTTRGGCYFQEGKKVKLEMTVDDAYKKSIETVLKWIRNEVNTNKTRVYFRTFAPVHFRGGDWRTGGSCHHETLPETGAASLAPSETWNRFKIVDDVLRSLQNASEPVRVQVLDITGMTGRRKDGHLSLYYRSPELGPVAIHRQDCSHWCLPGVPDSWNELLYAVFMKQEADAAMVNVSIYAAAPS